MRKPSTGIIPDLVLRDDCPSNILQAEYARQVTCSSIDKLERIPSILPVNNKVYLSSLKEQS